MSVAASSSRNVWAFGYLLPLNGSVSRADALRWTGSHWQVMPLPDQPGNMWAAAGGLSGAVFGPNDAWVTGGYGCSTQGGNCRSLVWHWTGANWAKQSAPVALHGFSGSSDRDLWLIGTRSGGGSGRTLAFRWNGVSWRRRAIPLITSASIAVRSPRDIWIVGRSARPRRGGFDADAEHWNGRRWIRSTLRAFSDGSAFLDGRGGVWFGPFLHETGGRWYGPDNSGPIWGGRCQQAGFAGAIGP